MSVTFMDQVRQREAVHRHKIAKYKREYRAHLSKAREARQQYQDELQRMARR